MAQVRKSGQNRSPIAQAVERAFSEGRQRSAAGAGDGADEDEGHLEATRPTPPRSTQSMVTVTSFLSSDPFLPQASPARPKPAQPADRTNDDGAEPGADESEESQ